MVTRPAIERKHLQAVNRDESLTITAPNANTVSTMTLKADGCCCPLQGGSQRRAQWLVEESGGESRLSKGFK
jgi:hypothetical protein